MLSAMRRRAPWILVWCVLTALGCLVLSRLELTRLRDAFDTDARIAHRLLSQRVVQHDAILATLALLQAADDGSHPEQRLSSVYPQILKATRSDGSSTWADERLRAAETVSKAVRRPAIAALDLARGRYELVLASEPASYALEIDLKSTVPWSEWPMTADSSPVRVTLDHEGQSFVLQPGRLREDDWRFEFHKHLAADSQPFDMVAWRSVGAGDLPWGWMAGWSVALAALLAAGLAWQTQRTERRRAEELLRLGQVARLNTLGELAAGMAHELNQPLTAVLANTQAASRLLGDEPPELETARHAMAQAVEQARRASEVVGRLRRAVERPDLQGQTQPVRLDAAVREVLYLLEPECLRRSVATRVEMQQAVSVLVEPVALEQIIHNLVMNALQAMEQMPVGKRLLTITLGQSAAMGVLTLQDSGPGIPAEVLPRIFEPFFTTRGGGLGLGLSLCETLAAGMGGNLTAANHIPHGAVFRLLLPLADKKSP